MKIYTLKDLQSSKPSFPRPAAAIKNNDHVLTSRMIITSHDNINNGKINCITIVYFEGINNNENYIIYEYYLEIG